MHFSLNTKLHSSINTTSTTYASTLNFVPELHACAGDEPVPWTDRVEYLLLNTFDQA